MASRIPVSAWVKAASQAGKPFTMTYSGSAIFHALALDPAMIGMLEVLFGEQVLTHSRNICRLVFPDMNAHSTPPHQGQLLHRWIGRDVDGLDTAGRLSRGTRRDSPSTADHTGTECLRRPKAWVRAAVK